MRGKDDAAPINLYGNMENLLPLALIVAGERSKILVRFTPIWSDLVRFGAAEPQLKRPDALNGLDL